MHGRCEIAFSERAEAWFKGLSPSDRDRVGTALDALEREGERLGKPRVKRIKSSRHPGEMKELRPESSNLRALFAFDPRGRAVVLVGGDKTNDWRGWYDRNVPIADRLLDQHLRTIGGGGRCQALA